LTKRAHATKYFVIRASSLIRISGFGFRHLMRRHKDCQIMTLTAPAEPFDYTFPPRGIALLVIDMQRDFVEPGGFGAALGNDVARLRPIIPTVAEAIAAFRRHRLPVIHTREGHRPDLSDCPPAKRHRGHSTLRIGDVGPMGRILVLGEPGNDIIPELAPIDGEVIIDKPGKGAFYATSLDAILRGWGIRHLAIAGVTTEVCVQTTMREANDRGYECLLLEDCTESYFPEFKRATLAMVRAQGGIVGWTASSKSLINALERA
jgi:nicotinamidase-related amidase